MLKRNVKGRDAIESGEKEKERKKGRRKNKTKREPTEEKLIQGGNVYGECYFLRFITWCREVQGELLVSD